MAFLFVLEQEKVSSKQSFFLFPMMIKVRGRVRGRIG